MSMKITFRCDAIDCFCEAESDVDGGEIPVPYQWGELDGYHYCRKCWPAVQVELVAASQEAKE